MAEIHLQNRNLRTHGSDKFNGSVLYLKTNWSRFSFFWGWKTSWLFRLIYTYSQSDFSVLKTSHLLVISFCKASFSHGPVYPLVHGGISAKVGVLVLCPSECFRRSQFCFFSLLKNYVFLKDIVLKLAEIVPIVFQDASWIFSTLNETKTKLIRNSTRVSFFASQFFLQYYLEMSFLTSNVAENQLCLTTMVY